jgi:hypothetical protein
MQAAILREEPKWEQSSEDPVQQNPALRCFHETTEYLGSGGSIVYRRCTRCGDVVLVQAGRAVAIPSR